MIQWCRKAGWFSLGVHIDFKKRKTGKDGTRYGPYVDLHLGILIVSVGVNPYYSSGWEGIISAGRGGEIADGIC